MTFPAHAQNEASAKAPLVPKAGYSVSEFCNAVSIGRSKLYELMGEGKVQSVTLGRRRIITESPTDFLTRLAKAAS